MRRPTPEAEAFAWWRAALADPRTPRHDGEPQPGLYRRRHVRNGPWCPVRIWLHQEIDPETGELAADEILRAEERGWPIDPYRAWLHLRPITREDYDDLVERHRTMQQMEATHARLDLSTTPIRPGD